MDGYHIAGVSTAFSGEHLAIFIKKFNVYTFWSQNFTLRIIFYRNICTQAQIHMDRDVCCGIIYTSRRLGTARRFLKGWLMTLSNYPWNTMQQFKRTDYILDFVTRKDAQGVLSSEKASFTIVRMSRVCVWVCIVYFQKDRGETVESSHIPAEWGLHVEAEGRLFTFHIIPFCLNFLP